MWGIKRRILKYAHENGRLPKSLVGLPEIPGQGDRTTDWWGNPIKYELSADGFVTLSSAGGTVWFHRPKDGAPLVCRFPSKKPNGEWSDELVPFVEDESRP